MMRIRLNPFRSATLALGVGVAGLFVSSTASASEPRTHDGLHLSLGVGAAYNVTGVAIDPEPPNNPDTSFSGAGIGALLMIGGTPIPGLAIGGASMGFHTFSPTVKIGDRETEAEGDAVGNLLGVYGDYYFDPHGGFHALAMFGFASLDDGDPKTDNLALGLGGVLGVGYDVFIADEWSLGGLLRLQMNLTGTRDDETKVDVAYGSIVPALLFTATYH